MNYKAVMFDFDYTLGDSTEGIVICMNHALHTFGHESKPVEAIRKTIGLTLPEAYQILEKDAKPEEGKKFQECFIEKAGEVMADNTTLYEGAVETIQKIKDKGIKVGVITTKNKRRIEEIFEKHNVMNLFDVIIGGDSVKHQKPSPEGVLSVLEILNLKKSEMLYVGDSTVDGKTANSAGVDFVAVTTGTTTKEELLAYNPIYVFDQVRELANYF